MKEKDKIFPLNTILYALWFIRICMNLPNCTKGTIVLNSSTTHRPKTQTVNVFCIDVIVFYNNETYTKCIECADFCKAVVS